jgi:metallo-beta-lactamase class B
LKIIANKLCLAVLFLFFICHANAQHAITLKVNVKGAGHLGDSIFVAGNFNSWNPAKTALTFNTTDSIWNVVLENLKDDVYEFKFTRGSWNNVEAGEKGVDIQNHIIKLASDTVVHYTILRWKDDFPTIPKKHTASKHVSLLDTAFYIPQLNRTRRIWIYLPQGYATSKKHYPVLYMHDGQNIFDEFTAGYGEWGVDEFLDSTQQQSKNACIVVGIDNGPERMVEYNPFDNEKFGNGEGKAYVSFIANTLKPFIDSKYRTLSNKENTIIAGSSMGGLISYYAAITYPNVFGKAGIFSPAFWTAPQMLGYTDSLRKQVNGKYFFYIGALEGDQYVNDMKNITDTLGLVSSGIIYSVTDPNGSHNEQAWRKWFPEFYKWIMSDWTNYVIKND